MNKIGLVISINESLKQTDEEIQCIVEGKILLFPSFICQEGKIAHMADDFMNNKYTIRLLFKQANEN